MATLSLDGDIIAGWRHYRWMATLSLDGDIIAGWRHVTLSLKKANHILILGLLRYRFAYIWK
jgi:hypothetical protein